MNQNEALDGFRRLYFWLVTGIIILVLIGFLVHSGQRVIEAGETRLMTQQAQQFQLQLKLLRHLWQSAGQPDYLLLTGSGQWQPGGQQLSTPSLKRPRFGFNTKGWPQVYNAHECRTLWNALLGQTELSASRVQVTYLESSPHHPSTCRYRRENSPVVELKVETGLVDIIKA